MDNAIRVFSGRKFSPEDIETIKWTRRRYPQLSQCELAGTICDILGWTTPSGRAKMQQCLVFLAQLEVEGILKLPPIQLKKQRKNRVHIPVYAFDTTEIIGDIQKYDPIRLVIAQPGEELKRWRSYVNQYHMLGDKWVFGSRLQYYVKSGDIELGCLQFSASSWSLEERDKWIGWKVEDRKARLQLIINNSRFLIFPWVHIRNLASKALSIAVKQIQKDWLQEYCYAPVLLETFVDNEFFKGVCYKASNWNYLGDTKGSGRSGGKEDIISRKAIFVYPLQDDFKSVLKGEKPYKAVEPL
ncbi:MAG: DUF4338 domain-containing protein [Candidatus Atribacteria bacterium]|nr:DUF4338 domain-containing protein [Candidatus Atribacteria bacterium]